MATTAHLHRSHATARDALHRIAAHVLARRRYEVSGHFGLRASPAGIATPSFGDAPETLRLSGVALVREVGTSAAYARVNGSSLRDLAVFAGTELETPFSPGAETPALGDADRPFDLDPAAVEVISDWYCLGSRVLDAVVAGLPPSSGPATIQLWPEHFDAATNVDLGSGEKVNLGFSPGDSFEPGPYAYLGPWSSKRPSDPAYWNAPFGAVLRWVDAHATGDPAVASAEFLNRGIRYLASA